MALPDRLPVITGLGAVSSIGIGADRFWEAIRSGVSGARPVRTFDTTAMRNTIGCEVVAELWEAAGREPGESIGRATQLAITAAREALEMASLEPDDVDAVQVGTTIGELADLERDDLPRLPGSFAAGIASGLEITSPAMTFGTSCSAGNLAIVGGAELIRRGRASRVLVGGADGFSRLAFVGFSRMRAMAPEVCAPFCRSRKGMLLGEGAGFLTLESWQSARQRGVEVLCSIPGYGLSCDGHHLTSPAPSGEHAARAMRASLAFAGLTPEDVDYVSAHGTGTLQNDCAESRALASVFGSHRPWVSSLKALIGHTLGAAGALEAVASVMSLRGRELIRAYHVAEQDPACPVLLPTEDRLPELSSLRTIISNAFAFGGNNSCLVLQSL